MGNLTAGMDGMPEDLDGSALAAYVGCMFDPSLSWPDLDWLRSLSDLPVLVKGVVHPDDARLAIEHGAAGVIVSNHGGRQLDTAPATLDVLAEIAAAVDGRAALLIDGGVRRGTDILKAIALGADAVAIGRPALWGLAVGGREGVGEVLRILRAELDAAMAMCGVTRVDQIGRELVR
jgi:4-hydroxymandelate oxidase